MSGKLSCFRGIMLFFEKDMTDFIIASVYFSSATNEHSEHQLTNSLINGTSTFALSVMYCNIS